VSRAILLVDHGSQLDAANALLDEIAEGVRRRRPDAIVEVAHMELATPSLAEGLARCAARGVSEVVVCPYFLAPGRHTSRDIPRLVEQASTAHPGLRVSVSAPLGYDERLVDLVLARADSACG
jgi:sirohydrochlorin ferrochelatase